jgi:glycosyltransferase involved in cell wall biosynthesis
VSSAAPRVAVVTGWSADRAPGLARYATELVAALERTGAVADRAGVELTVVDPSRTGAARVAWSQSALLGRLLRLAPALVHVTAPPSPLAWRGPTVLTLHDLSLLRSPAWHPRRRGLLSAPLLRTSARRATRLIVPSRATAADVAALLDLDPGRIAVIPEAPAGWFRPVTDAATLQATARRYGVRPGCVLAVGTLEPRKNLARLADACSRLRADGWDGQLVLAGADGWPDPELKRRIAAAQATTGEPIIRLLGRVPDDDLPALLSLAGAVAYPSLLEGFGLPIVEAMACGAVVVTADQGATAEVAGDAAVLVDPEDTAALAAGLAAALTPGPTRDRLLAAGPVRAATFTWEAAAHATAEVYARTLEDAA